MDSHDPDDSLAAEVADLRWLGQLALRLVTDPSIADDACQEAWLAASRGGTVAVDRRGLVQGLRSFLWRTQRADRRRRRREQEAERRSDFPSTAEVLEAGEQRKRVWEHLMRLDEPYRSTLVLRYQEDYSTAVIAAEQGLSVDTVRWRLRRGLDLLRASLERDSRGGGMQAVALAIPASIRRSALIAVAAPTATVFGIGVIAMLKLAAAVAVGAVTLALLVDRPTAPDTASTVTTDSLRTTGEVASLTAPDVDPAPAPAPVDEVVEREGLASGPAVEPALLLGRVVDTAGRPRSDIELTYTVRGRTAEATSALDGSFRIELPRVDAPESSLSFLGSATVDRGYVQFEIGGDDDPPPAWQPGSVTDIGDLVLADAGILTGRVVDPEGAPIEGAIVYVSGSPKSPSNAGGHFRAEHVEPDADSVRIQCPGFLDRRVAVEPVALAVHDIGEITLTPAPTVRGVVVDERGAPVSNARVRTEEWDRHHEVPVALDGTFEIHLRTLERPTVTALAPGLASPYFAVPVRPGTDDAVIVLRDIGEVCRLRVVDDVSGAPVEYLMFEVDRHGGHRGQDPAPRLEFKPTWERSTDDGWIAFRAEPGESVIDVAAYGYASAALAVTGEDQVLRLRRPVGVSGRVLENGVPVEGAVVLLASADLGATQPHRDGVDRIEPIEDHPLLQPMRNQGGYSMPEVRLADPAPAGPIPAIVLARGTMVWTPSQRTTTTGPDGRFTFPDPEPLGHQVVARSPDGQLVARTELAYDTGSGIDFGDLELEPTATIAGHIDTLDGQNLGGHRVRICSPEVLEATTDPDGGFRLEGLSPGGHLLYVKTGDTLANESWAVRHYVEVAPGAVQPAALTLEAVASAEIALEVTRNGRPLADSYAKLIDEDGQSYTGYLDEEGRGTAVVPAGRLLQLEISLENGSRVRVDDGRTFSTGRTELRFDVTTTPIDVELPAGLALPSDAVALLHWTDAEGRRQPPCATDLTEVDGIRARFAHVPVGARIEAVALGRGTRYRVKSEVRRWDVEATATEGDAVRIVLAE